jgi:hypothetical protein
MKTLILVLIPFLTLTAAPATPAATERLGTVSFAVTCTPAVQTEFVRGVALLHDFWYQEAQRQFEQIAKADPSCCDGALGRGDELLPPNLGPTRRWHGRERVARDAGRAGASGEERPRARLCRGIERFL